MNTTTLDRQSLLDLALQLHGDISAIFTIAEANGLNLTQEPAAGQLLQHTPANTIDRTVVNHYANRHHIPATALSPELTSGDGAILLEGIEYWGIQYDFIVS